MTGIGALLGGLGLVAVGFGLLSAMLALFQPVSSLNVLIIVGNLAIGVVLLSAGLFMSFDKVRERLRSGEAKRVGKYGSNALVSTLLGIVLLGMGGYLANRHSVRFDWTESKVNTLTEQTLGLLEKYSHASDRIQVRFIDPNSAPGLVEDLALDPEALARGLVRVQVGEDGVVVSELSEASITNALLKLASNTQKKIYFIDGHNERLISNEEGKAAEGKESVGRAAEALRNETYRVEGLNLASSESVPEDADALVIAGPTRAYFDHELEAIRAFVAGGGGVMLLIDPRARTNLYDSLAGWGVVLGDDVVVDQNLALFGQATSPFAGAYSPEHPITSEMRETTLFPMVRSVEALEGGAGQWETLVLTSPDSWAERDLDGWRKTGRAALGADDLEGPVPIAMAGTLPSSGEGEGDGEGKGKGEARLVVFGDSDWISNEYLDTARNKDLLLNSVNWLLGDVEQIAVRPHTSRASRFQLDAAQYRMIQLLSLFALPEAIAVMGVVAWWRRSGRGGQ